MELQSKIDQLKAARETHAAEKETADNLYEELKLNPDFLEWEKAKTLAKTSGLMVDELEVEVRTLAVDIFKAGTKQPHEKVKIEMHTIVKPYNEAAAREWCFTNFRPALVLDTKTFEKAAKDGQIPVNIVETDAEPRAKIASKL